MIKSAKKKKKEKKELSASIEAKKTKKKH